MLNYIEKHLNANEVVVYKARKSPMLLAKPALVALVLAVVGAQLNQAGSASALPMCLLIGAIYVAACWFNLRQQELVITNRRIVSKDGLLRKRLQDCPLDKVDTIQVANGFAGSILGYGTVAVKAMNGAFTFDHVVGAAEFRNQVMRAIDAGRDAERAQEAQRLAEAMRLAMAARV